MKLLPRDTLRRTTSSRPVAKKPLPAYGVFGLGLVIGGIIVFLLFVVLQRIEMHRKIENLGRAAPPKSGITFSEGAFLTPLERRIGRSLTSDGRLRSAVAYLRQTSGFRAGIRLDANACWGTGSPLGTHWDGDNRSLEVCLVQFEALHERLITLHENADRQTQDAAFFAILHELGHVFLMDQHVPVLGRDEDAADEFAVHMALALHQSAIVDAGARFFETELRDGGVSDPHVDPARRAYRIRCLVYGAAPKHLATWRSEHKTDAECINMYRTHSKSWSDVLRYSKAHN